MIPLIKFNKEYKKLHGQTEAILLNVRTIHFNDLPEKFIEYDTKAIDGSYYELPNTILLHLTFLGNDLIPFCTLRAYTQEKEQFYKNNIYNIFKIERTW